MANLNVLSDRYVTHKINDIFSTRGKIISSRDLWLAVMIAQKELGVDNPSEDIEKFEKAKEDIDFDFTRERELATRHEIKAMIEDYIRAAGAREILHKRMTSRDLTDNVEQMQIKNASKIILGKNVSIVRHFVEKANEYNNIILTARTHHQASQPTLLGRRMAMWNEELLYHLANFETFIKNYPLRGIKGPVGTQFDMLELLGSMEKVKQLEKRVAEMLGFSKILDAPGQVYFRSLDYDLACRLSCLSTACGSFATTMRLMAGYELVTEGFIEGQVGSTAMPHKMNTRSSERICSFVEEMKSYVDATSRIAGNQWEEGDVFCSALRRVNIPDVFYASDGLCETVLTVLNEMGAYPIIISNEVDRYLPFMASTEILGIATEAGMGREEAHAIIKKYAVEEALKMRKEGKPPELAKRLAEDPAFKEKNITKERIEGILKDKEHFIGNARNQIIAVNEKAKIVIEKYKSESKYEPEEIL
jgi:adenylosuccinate lyase